MKFIFYPDEKISNLDFGGKAGALASLHQTNALIPEWFVISPEAFWHSLSPVQKESLNNFDEPRKISARLNELLPSELVQREIAKALKSISPNKNGLAVRSSAIGEDGPIHSFAGQLESFLFVSPNEIMKKIVAVWQSGFSDTVLSYRSTNGIEGLPLPPAVIIQRMVDADFSGVAFGADPISGRRDLTVISAVRGVADLLVSGECDADSFRINRDGEIVERKIATDAPLLNDAQLRSVYDLVQLTGRHFNRPQDIEWAIENGRIYLLQARPITTLNKLVDPNGVINLWDNSNIAESYSGVTTPLTFSFARRAYEEVYRQFCRLMLVPEAVIAKNDQTFRHLLGLIRGRIYYNLLNWYRVLALLPGFKFNRRFMEQMMGVREGLPADLAGEIGARKRSEKLRDGLYLLRTIVGLIVNYFLLPNKIRSFYERLETALSDADPKLEKMRIDELALYYRRLESQLLTRWDAPLINDFLAMIFNGLLRKLVQKWSQGNEDVANNLLCDEGNVISAEPARCLRQMASEICHKKESIDLLCYGSLIEIQGAISENPQFQIQIDEYFKKFGDRCLDELKLESPSLIEEPLIFYRSIGQLANKINSEKKLIPVVQEISSLRRAAEKRAQAQLARAPHRGLVFHWVLKNARERIRQRENLRFERTRLFGQARRLFIEIGKRLFAENLLEQPRDIFFLEVEEVLGFVEGLATTTDLKGLVAVRKAEFERHLKSPIPADRFETHGAIHLGNQFQSNKIASILLSDDTRRGLACCPGIVRGKVRVVSEPRTTKIYPGEILVAERTDPGWILLFPTASGLLIERGSLLSHSAIVSREMGIPSIVSVPEVTQWLKTGDEVEFDGSTGWIKKINERVNEIGRDEVKEKLVAVSA